MAGDEGLGYIIGIGVDDEGVQPALEKVEQAVGRSAENVNAALEKLGNVDVFSSLMRGADATALKMHEVTQAVEQGMAVLTVFAETQHAAQTGSGLGITKLGGYSQVEIESMVASLRELQRAGAQSGSSEGLRSMGDQAEYATRRIAELEAQLERLNQRQHSFAPATEDEAFIAESQAQRVRNAEIGAITGRDPLADFQGPNGTNVTAAQQEAATSRALAAQMAAEKAASAEKPNEQRILTTSAASITAALAEEKKLAAVEAQGTVYERVAAVQEQLVGLSDKEAQATLGVLAARERIAQANEVGLTDSVRLLQLTNQLIASEERLASVKEKEARQQASAGGGFFGGVGRGFTTGFGSGGGGGHDPIAEAGFQLGMVAQYTLYYQLFRDIETAIKESVNQALQFDRAVTDLANRLGISRDNARGLANTIGQMGAVAGLGPAETVGYAASYTGVFSGQADNTTLMTQGAQTASQLQVLTGHVKEDLPDVISVVQAFNLSFEGTQRVLDAATSAAQNYGLANASSVLPGLAQIGDLAAQSGFSLEQTANAIADIQTRTNDSSQAVAGELQRFLGRAGTPAFQSVFQGLGISGGSFDEEISQLSERFDKLSASQKSFIVSEFGGGRAGVAALAFIEDYNRILGNTQKSLDDGGIAQRNYAQRLSDIVGIINSIRGELKELAKDVGTSGLGAGFGIALEAVKPFVELLDEAVRLVNYLDSFGGHFTLGRDLVAGAAEIAAAMAVLGRLNVGSRIAGVFGRGRGGADGEPTPTSIAADATTSALERLTVALNETTTAATRDTAATNADAVAKERDAVATDVDAVSKTADAAATDLETAGKLRNALATGASSIASLFGASGIGGLSGAGLFGAARSLPGLIGGAILTQQVYDAGSKVFPAIGAGQQASAGAFQGGTSVDDLQNQAQALREAAAKARASSGGLFGTIENAVGATEGRLGRLQGYNPLDIIERNTLGRIPGIGRVTNFLSNPFGGENSETTGDVSSRLGVQAHLLALEAQRAKDAQAQSVNAGDFSSLIDLTKQGGVAAGLKSLTDQGLDSGQQLDVLNQKLASFAAAANGAANYLAQGSAALVSQNFANTAVNNLIGFANQGGVASRFGSKDFQKNVAPGLNDVIDKVAQTFLAPLQGQDITPQDQKDLEQQTQAAALDYMRQHGFSKDEVAQGSQWVHASIGAAIMQTVAQQNAARGQKISADAIGGVVQALPGLMSGTQQEVTTAAALGQASAPDGTAVAGIQAALAKGQNTLLSLQASGATPDKLKAAQDQVDNFKVQLQSATLANIDAQAQLAAASIPSENATQQLVAHIADVQAQLAATQNPDDILKLTTDLRKSQQQLAASQAQDAISAIGIRDNPADQVKLAGDALARANAQVASYQARGVTGAAMNQAISQATQAQYAYTVAVVNDANALRDANVAVGDKVGDAYAKYQDLLNTATTQVGGQRADTLKQAAQQYLTFLQTQQEQSNAVAVAGIDPRNKTALDAQKLRNDLQNLAILQKNSPADVTDIANLQTQVAQDRLTAARDAVDKANARTSANTRSGDPYAEANAQLTEARRTLSTDLVGQAQYYQDLKAVHDAEAALASAIAAHAKNTLLLRGDTTDPVANALADLASARVQLAQDQARHTGNLQADELAVEQAQWSAQKAAFDQQMSLQQQSFDLHRESAGQYLQFLEGQDTTLRAQLAGMKKGTEGYQQLVDELNSVDQAILGLNSQVEGQFNLGDVKVPSIFEVRRSIAEGSQQVIDASTTTNNVTLNGVDITQVITYINSILGVTGTASRAATATRKAA